jgi:signal peptidase I
MVRGESMRPTLEPGDRLVVLSLGRPRQGDLVALEDPERPGRQVVKRIGAGPGGEVTVDGRRLQAKDGYVVLGDRPSLSVDSRHYGPVSLPALRGRVVYRYGPADRAGRPR